jgi:carboxymethylenebutenolidase
MFEATLKQLGKRVEIKIYPDAGHGFENPNNKAGYRPDDAADAWKRTITFLADTLKNKNRPLIAIGIRRLPRARSHK